MKYVLVTGGSQGLGASIVNVFANNQYNVIIGYLNNKDKASELCDHVNSKYNVNCIAKKIDITCEDDVNEMTNAKTFSLEPMEEYKGLCFVKKDHVVIDQTGKEYPCCRATNDNGEDWEGKYCLDNLNNIDDEKVLYDFCSDCDRYRKFNENYKEKVESKKVVYL